MTTREEAIIAAKATACREAIAEAEQRVAEACAKVCDKTIAELGYRLPADVIRSGEWRKYL